MSSIDNDTLEKIKELAGLFLSIREIALLTGLDYEKLQEMVEDDGSEVSRAYREGKAHSKYEIRRKVIQLAKLGSPQAEVLANKYIEEQEIEEND
jgi:hypothetical protein